MAGGRPSDYSQETVDLICLRLAEGDSLRKICRDEDMPSVGTVCRWLTKNTEFQEQYARAREAQGDTLFDECLDIADQYDKASDKLDPDHIQRAKLRIDTRKWMAGKLRPKKYGDKVQTEVSGSLDINNLYEAISNDGKSLAETVRNSK
jgi:hypothetical protein